MTTTTFKNAIKKACKNYHYFGIVKTICIEDDGRKTFAAIVSIKETEKSIRHYTIYYQYSTMSHIDNIGYFESIWENGEIKYNAYIDACSELAKFAN